MVYLTTHESIFVSTQTALDTPATPAPADHVRLMDLGGVTNEGIKMIDRANITGRGGGADQPLYGGTLGSMSFSHAIAAKTYVETAKPEAHALLNSIMKYEHRGSSHGTTPNVHHYRLSTDEADLKPFTATYTYGDNSVTLINSLLSSLSFSFTTGEQAKMSGSIMGQRHGEGTGIAATAKTVYESNPIVVLGTEISIDGVSGVTVPIMGLSIELGLKTTARPDITDADGYSSCVLTNWAITGKIDPEMISTATRNWFRTYLRANKLLPIEISLNTGQQVNTETNNMIIRLPQCSITQHEPEATDEVRREGLTFSAYRGVGANGVEGSDFELMFGVNGAVSP